MCLRLSHAVLVLEAVRDGLASTVWVTETFAYASSFDAERERYVGLQAGRVGIVVSDDPNSIIVKPSVAHRHLDTECQSSGAGATPPVIRGDTVPPTSSPGQTLCGKTITKMCPNVLRNEDQNGCSVSFRFSTKQTRSEDLISAWPIDSNFASALQNPSHPEWMVLRSEQKNLDRTLQ
jgi:hypothetical protein